jgi:hypothetical protein
MCCNVGWLYQGGVFSFFLFQINRKLSTEIFFLGLLLTLAVWLVADFEALLCQVTTTFDTSCAAQIRTAPAINYTACYAFVLF